MIGSMEATTERRDEQLKDRRDYREALIHRRNEIDAKIKRVEEQIHKLRNSEAQS